MKCSGKFVYKGIEKKDGGEFTNDKGNLIKFDPSYQILLDEDVEGRILPRRFKFPLNNNSLCEKFKSFKIYDEILITFDVSLYNSNARLVPVDVVYPIDELNELED